MTGEDLLLKLLARFKEEAVEYVLVGGQAVRLNGFLRATEAVDLLLRATRANGAKVKRALAFLPSSEELDPDWFESTAGEPENIRVADDLLVDLRRKRRNLRVGATLRPRDRDRERADPRPEHRRVASNQDRLPREGPAGQAGPYTDQGRARGEPERGSSSAPGTANAVPAAPECLAAGRSSAPSA